MSRAEAFAPLEPTEGAQAATPKGDKWRPILPAPEDAGEPSMVHSTLGKPSMRWAYRDAEGRVLCWVARYETGPGAKEFRTWTFGSLNSGQPGWRSKAPSVPRPLYGLDRLAARPDAPVLVCEGEKAADAAQDRFPALVVVSSMGGAEATAKADWSPLQNRRVAIWPDADGPGAKFASEAQRLVLDADASHCGIVELPDGLPDKWDLANEFPEGFTVENALARIEAALASETAAPTRDAEPTAERGRSSQATRILELLATVEYEAFLDDAEQCFVTFSAGAHHETHLLRSSATKGWLGRLLYDAEGTAPTPNALDQVMLYVEAKARYTRQRQRAFVRLGSDRPGRMYLDLGGADWRAVEIDATGWRIIAGHETPIRFRRAAGMLAIPDPVRGGSLDELREFVNVGDGTEGDARWRLLVGWIVGALRPSGPYPVLALHGEQGSAKSTTSRLLRALLDPNKLAIRAEPREVRDLAIAATNGHVVALDNLSSVPPWLSDALCRLATGGGFATRALYTDAAEAIFDAQRPVLLNGIEELANRSDLLDRAIVLALPRIPDDQRRTESRLWTEFEAARPRILGALLDAVASAFANEASVKLERLPRMADFAVWVQAAGPALPWAPGEFLRAYFANRATSHEAAIEASPVGQAVRGFMADREEFSDTMTELLAALAQSVTPDPTGSRGWPKNARGLRGALDRIAPNLRAVGVAIEHDRDSGPRRNRIVRLRREKAGARPSEPSGQSEPTGNQVVTSGRSLDGRSRQPSEPSGNRPELSARNCEPSDGLDGLDGRIPMTISRDEANGWGDWAPIANPFGDGDA
jgi:hypothetical protein